MLAQVRRDRRAGRDRRRRARPALPPHGGDACQRQRDHHLQGISAHRHVERARELYPTCRATRSRGEMRPVMALYDCRMVTMWRTRRGADGAASSTDEARRVADGILSVSFGHGFPWGDVADVGAKMSWWSPTATGKAHALAAAARASGLGHAPRGTDAAATRSMRRSTRRSRPREGPTCSPTSPTMPAAARRGQHLYPASPARARHRHGVARAASGTRSPRSSATRPASARRFDLRIGGKCGVVSGPPVDLHVTVRAVVEQHSAERPQRRTRLLRTERLGHRQGHRHRALTSRRQQVFAPDAFTGLGCSLHDKRIIVVKSMQHFYAGFAPVVKAIRYVAAPGTVGAEFANLPFTKITRPWLAESGRPVRRGPSRRFDVVEWHGTVLAARRA